MSELNSTFDIKQAKKRKRERIHDVKTVLGLALGTVAIGTWLVSNDYVDNPFDIHQDSTISVEDSSANK